MFLLTSVRGKGDDGQFFLFQVQLIESLELMTAIYVITMSVIYFNVLWFVRCFTPHIKQQNNASGTPPAG